MASFFMHRTIRGHEAAGAFAYGAFLPQRLELSLPTLTPFRMHFAHFKFRTGEKATRVARMSVTRWVGNVE